MEPVSYTHLDVYKRQPYWGTTTNQSETFYALPEDAIDVMTVGSSSLLVSVSPLVMWDAQGITSYSRCTSVQAPLILSLIHISWPRDDAGSSIAQAGARVFHRPGRKATLWDRKTAHWNAKRAVWRYAPPC